jgi:hypothetical protein
MDTLEEIRRQIRSGQWQAARRALIARLGDHPHDVDAWMLLATVLDDAEKQADCYRQVLGLDPGHRQAARALAQLAASGEEARPRVLRCPGCGGAMEVYIAGALHDKRARCPYCGTDVDVPDSFQRVQRTHTAEEGAGFQRVEETLTVESRSDAGAASLTAEDLRRLMQAQAAGSADVHAGLGEYDHTFTKDDLRRLLAEHGLSLSDGELDDVMGRFVFTEHEGRPGEHVVIRRIETRRNLGQAFRPKGGEPQGCLAALLGIFGETHVSLGRARPAPPAEMDVETIVKAAGIPLLPEERRCCPHCGATLSEHATRCDWCGTDLGGAET